MTHDLMLKEEKGIGNYKYYPKKNTKNSILTENWKISIVAILTIRTPFF